MCFGKNRQKRTGRGGEGEENSHASFRFLKNKFNPSGNLQSHPR